MKCSKYRKQLVPWLDGELKPDRADALRAWFESCAELRQCTLCQAEIQAHQSLKQALQSLPQPEFPAFMHHRIMDKVINSQPVYRKQAVRTRWQAIPAALAILLSLYFGSLIGVRTFTTQSTTSTESSELSSFGENSLLSSFYETGGQE
jgi:anti-sigma factor RsiW